MKHYPNRRNNNPLGLKQIPVIAHWAAEISETFQPCADLGFGQKDQGNSNEGFVKIKKRELWSLCHGMEASILVAGGPLL